jgi:hypothetical protein
MTRSILWISFKVPPPSIACGALPQPRSRMALAAATLAAGVASFERITPTSTLSAVRVWLRASEGISVTALVIWNFGFLGSAAARDDLHAHDNPSHNTMTTRPTSESDIKYAVITASLIGVWIKCAA